MTRTNLPPLQLVKFTGDPCKYLQFKSRFDEMVLMQDLTESQQMSGLLQFLDGPARIAVILFGQDEHDQHSPNESKTSDNPSSEMERERSTNLRAKTESQRT